MRYKEERAGSALNKNRSRVENSRGGYMQSDPEQNNVA